MHVQTLAIGLIVGRFGDFYFADNYGAALNIRYKYYLTLFGLSLAGLVTLAVLIKLGYLPAWCAVLIMPWGGIVSFALSRIKCPTCGGSIDGRGSFPLSLLSPPRSTFAHNKCPRCGTDLRAAK